MACLNAGPASGRSWIGWGGDPVARNRALGSGVASEATVEPSSDEKTQAGLRYSSSALMSSGSPPITAVRSPWNVQMTTTMPSGSVTHWVCAWIGKSACAISTQDSSQLSRPLVRLRCGASANIALGCGSVFWVINV